MPSAAAGTAYDAVKRAVIQAQDARAARLGVRARTKGLTEEDVERERLEDRSFVRAWAMRGTIHLIASEDYPWIRDLVAAPQIRGSHLRMAQEGMPPAMYERALPIVRKLLEGGPATRAEMRETLAAKGIEPAGRQALVHLLNVMTYEGEIVTGPYVGGKETMVLVRDWLPRAPAPPRDPPTELVRLYLEGYGPATLEDFRWWSGLRAADARAGFASLGDRLVDEGGGLVRLRSQRRVAGSLAPVKLLPMWDHYHLGYRDRAHVSVPSGSARKLSAGGVFSPLVVVDGKAVALWKLVRRGAGFEVELLPLGRMPAGLGPGIGREAEALGRFLGADVAVKKQRIR